ncbi:NAD(P)/FAD-dependent oxidoreductase [Galbibacter pacificus]|uniref:FAD-dependent oxidoreductase n=1 Tax=Galbibacter pacificus TaxID=2996052 RepID=A0ABT6FSG5_9FLAO|nr:FAD-dependent oxidoreductase [Galbibacter pacificus]MDG3582673.1 FAD-dependent oxidoreductase [Galbibacter pacificus]MDG3586208.1 FAD-dependent oxidoreductase [Galbibacter pacificus]
MQKNIVIIGGGIIGLSSAYYLQKEGHQVTVIDKSDISEGASFVNAGYITPSHIIPLASPGMIAKGIKWMFNSSSPFYMKPRWDADFFKWSWYFHKSSTPEKVAKAIPVISEINVLSRTLYKDLIASRDLGQFHWEHKGLLMLYKTDKAGESEMAVAEKAKKEGLEARHVDKNDLKVLEPNVTIDAKGAIFYECDAHSTPTEIMPKLVAFLKKNGVAIKTNETVENMVIDGNKVKIIQTNKAFYNADEMVIAAGSWSEGLAKKLGLKLPVQAGKGYRIDLHRPTGIELPAILMEAKAAMTPMNGFTRFAGTMEFSGINKTIRKERVEAIARAAKAYYPEIEITPDEKNNAQSGLRPVSPDGLPYIGCSSKYKNITFATGHAMMGWSLGPATGKLVSEIIDGKKLSMNIDAFHPDRKF